MAKNWKVNEVCDWLKSLSISDEIIKKFQDKKISGESLLSYKEKDLTKLGVDGREIKKKYEEKLKQEKEKSEKIEEQKKIEGKVGLIYSCGLNKFGELCFGDTNKRNKPELVKSLKDKEIIQVCAGHSFTILLSSIINHI